MGKRRMNEQMIVAKTKMKRIPETCKKCSMAENEYGAWGVACAPKRCLLTGRDCPQEKKLSGNVGYGKPDWCPLTLLSEEQKTE